MVEGMSSALTDTPATAPVRTDVTDWLAGRGRLVPALTLAVIVAFGAVAQVFA